jgi:hypothetical protein
MTALASTEQLLAIWRELEAERDRRFKEKMDADQAVRVRVILDELEADCAAEEKDKALAAAKARAIAALPEKDRGKSVGWITRSITRPRVNRLSPQDVPAESRSAVVPREGGEPNAPKPAAVARVWEEKQGVVRP